MVNWILVGVGVVVGLLVIYDLMNSSDSKKDDEIDPEEDDPTLDKTLDEPINMA